MLIVDLLNLDDEHLIDRWVNLNNEKVAEIRSIIIRLGEGGDLRESYSYAVGNAPVDRLYVLALLSALPYLEDCYTLEHAST